MADLDDVLRRVAAGELTPEEALELLPPATGTLTTRSARRAADPAPAAQRAIGAPPARTAETGLTQADDGSGEGSSPLRLVRLRTSYRSIEVIGDPAVHEVFVAGAHSLRRVDDELIVENPTNRERADDRGPRYRFTSLPFGLARNQGWRDEHVVVRVHPDIRIEAEVSGAQLRLANLRAGVGLQVAATAVRFLDVHGPLEVDAISSSLKGTVGITGTSAIDCESTSVKVTVLPDTDVTVTVRNRMGKVELPQVTRHERNLSKGGIVDPDLVTATIGSGAGTLAIDALMSSIMLFRDRGFTAPSVEPLTRTPDPGDDPDGAPDDRPRGK
jgi:hypothetical protein